MSKNPWIWSECRSIVSRRSTPALWIMFATSFAVIADARGARPAILARVAEVRHHRRDLRRRRAPAGIDHHQQLHQVVVGRRTRGLHDEHIAPAHVLHQLDVHLAVGEPADVGAAQRRRQVTRDVVRQRRIGVAREQRQRFRFRHSLRIGVQPSRILYGWGGRIRTSEWRDQNPLPYHLATPQRPNSSSSGRFVQQGDCPARARRTRATCPAPAPRRAPRPPRARISRTRTSRYPSVAPAHAAQASPTPQPPPESARARPPRNRSARPFPKSRALWWGVNSVSIQQPGIPQRLAR